MANENSPLGKPDFSPRTTERGGSSIGTPQREKIIPPTPEEIRAANAGELAPRGITGKVLDAAKKHPVATGGAAIAVVVAGFAAVEATQGNIPRVHRDAVSPDLDSATFSDKNISSNFDIIHDSFREPPPNRIPDTSFVLSIDALQQVTVFKNMVFSVPNMRFRLEAKPDQVLPTKIFNAQHPEGIIKEVKQTFPANVNISGYLVGKEKNPDGSILLAVEIPKEPNNLFSIKDVDEKVTPIINWETSGDNAGTLSGNIVWLKLSNNWANYPSPLAPTLRWFTLLGGIPTASRTTKSPDELFRYLRIGDPIPFATGPIQLSPAELNLLDENYEQKKANISYPDAKQQYSNMANANMTTMLQMLEDAKKGGSSPRQQFENRYILQVNFVDFIPRN